MYENTNRAYRLLGGRCAPAIVAKQFRASRNRVWDDGVVQDEHNTGVIFEKFAAFVATP